MNFELTGNTLSYDDVSGMGPCDRIIADESPTFEETQEDLRDFVAPRLFRSAPPCNCSVSRILSKYNITQLTVVHDFLFPLLKASGDDDPSKYAEYSRQGLENCLPEEKIGALAQRCHGIFHELPSKTDFQDSRLCDIYFKALSSLEIDQIKPFPSEILKPLINATRLDALNAKYQEYLDSLILGFWQSLPPDNLKFLINFFLIYCVHSHKKMGKICSIFNVKFNPNTTSMIGQKKRFYQLTSKLQNNDLAILACRIMKIIQAKIDCELFDPAPSPSHVKFITPPINTIIKAIPKDKMPFFMKFIALKLTQSPWRYRLIIKTVNKRSFELNNRVAAGKVLPDSNFNIDTEILSILTCDWY